MITFVNSKMKSNNILDAMILMIKNCNVSCLIMIFTLEHIIKQIERKSSNTNIIYYLKKKPKGKRNDVVHHLFRHVRNSVAHGHVIKSGRNKLRFDDFSMNDNKTMEGIIDQKVFQLLMEKLKSAKIKV